MSTYSESHLKDRLLSPPSYAEATRHQGQIVNQSYIPANVQTIVPSAPVATDVNYVQPPHPTSHSYRAIIITGIIVCGLVTIALIASLTFIFVKHNSVTTTTTTTTTTSTTTTTTTKRPICFDGDAFLVKQDGSRLKIRDLKIGDQVLVAYDTTNEGVKLRSSPVLAVDIFQKYNNDSIVDFLEIWIDSNVSIEPLRITPKHSLLVKKEHDSQAKYLFASQVQSGDYLYLRGDDYQSAMEVKVTRIKSIELFDAYAPLTFEGTLVVNDIVVSCYGTLTHSFVHFIMTPRRWTLYYALQTTLSLMGPKFAKENIDLLHTYFVTIDLFRLSIRNQIRDFIQLFEERH